MKSGDLDDTTVPVRLKLSALWTAIMFCYIYGDFWGLYRPGNLRGILDGQGPLGPTSQGTLVAVAILVAVPAIMIFLSTAAPRQLTRWLNILVSTILTVIILLTLPGAWAFYIVMSAIEITLQVLIVWYAWRWPSAGFAALRPAPDRPLGVASERRQ
jgi:hypothetical protein